MTTLGSAGEPIGLTITSFNSVSLEPPLVLWSIALRAASLPAFRANPHFAINVLAAEQSAVCQTFSTHVKDRFLDIDWTPGLFGVPVLSGCAACFECATYARYAGGDHEITVGEVIRLSHSQLVPLVFGQGKLGPLHSDGDG